MKFISLTVVAALGVLTLTMRASAISDVVWKPVPGTKINNDFWYVGTNTIDRQGARITFDVRTNSKQYVLYSANCQTRMMQRLAEGSVKTGKIVVYERYREAYFPPNEVQRKVLNYAGSQKR
jgi:hypothetical protein